MTPQAKRLTAFLLSATVLSTMTGYLMDREACMGKAKVYGLPFTHTLTNGCQLADSRTIANSCALDAARKLDKAKELVKACELTKDCTSTKGVLI